MGISIDKITDAKLRKKIEEADRVQNLRGNLDRLSPEESKQDQRSESQDRELEKGQASVAIRIGFTLFSGRRLDSDNLISSLKVTRDCVCESLGLSSDKDSEHLSFEYHQVLSKTPGVLVKIECERT